MKWSGSIVLLLSMSAAAFAGSSTPPPDAQTLYSQSLAPYMGNGQGVKTNLVTPLLSGGTLKSVDGQKAFQVTSFNASNSPLMKITVNSNPPTGDVRSVEVDQDLSGSGSLSTVSFFPAGGGLMIAGICANGIIECNPGTYSGCSYYLWTTDTSGKMVAQNTSSFSDLQSCYCFNNSCSSVNNSAAMNIDSLTSDIAAGIISSFVSATNYAVTNTVSAGSGIVECFGTKPAAGIKNLTVGSSGLTSAASATSSTSTDTVYPYTDVSTLTSSFQSNPSGLRGMGQSAKSIQDSTPNSLGNLVGGAMASSTGNTFNCTNLRSENMNVVTKSASRNGTLNPYIFCTDHQGMMIVNHPDPSTWTMGVQGYSPGFGGMGANCPPWVYPLTPELGGINAMLLDTFSPFSNTGSTSKFQITQLDVNISMSGGGCDNVGTGQFTMAGPTGMSVNSPVYVKTSLICSAKQGQWPGASWIWTANFQEQDVQESIVDACQPYETDAKCKLQTDIWDGRPVVINYTPTGFKLNQVAKDFPGPLSDVQLYRDWWKQQRTYYCDHSPQAYDFSAILAREDGIHSSASVSSSTMTYSDGGQALTYQVPQKGTLPGCPQVCKTKTPVKLSAVDQQGPVSNYQSAAGQAAASFKFIFKDCMDAGGGNYTCPINNVVGETVATACGCSADFGEAISSISTMNAAQDAICSGN